jgi:hypothetical protein
VEPAVGSRGIGQGGLRLEEGVLDPLGLERLVHRVGRRGQGGVDVAPAYSTSRQHVAVEAPHRVLGSSMAATGSVMGAWTS